MTKEHDSGVSKGAKAHEEPVASDTSDRMRFNRVEFAGALGDLGSLLPIVVAMILINKLSPSVVFLSFGLFYLYQGEI